MLSFCDIVKNIFNSTQPDRLIANNAFRGQASQAVCPSGPSALCCKTTPTNSHRTTHAPVPHTTNSTLHPPTYMPMSSNGGPRIALDESGALRPLCSCGCSCNQLLDKLIQAMDAQGIRKRVFDMVDASSWPSNALTLGSGTFSSDHGSSSESTAINRQPDASPPQAKPSCCSGKSLFRKLTDDISMLETSPFLNSGSRCSGSGLLPSSCCGGADSKKAGPCEADSCGCSCSRPKKGPQKLPSAANDPSHPNVQMDTDGDYSCGCGCQKPLAECTDCVNDFCEKVLLKPPS